MQGHRRSVRPLAGGRRAIESLVKVFIGVSMEKGMAGKVKQLWIGQFE